MRVTNNLHDKDPSAEKWYYIDYTAWLTGATLISSVWAIDPADGELAIDDATFSATRSQVKLSGGLDGVDYRAVNHVETATEADDGVLHISVREGA